MIYEQYSSAVSGKAERNRTERICSKDLIRTYPPFSETLFRGDSISSLNTDKDGRYCVKISGIAAHELSKDHIITVSTAEGHTATVTISALSYVNSALNYYNDENDADLIARNAVAAIYEYAKAADAYKSAHSNG